MQAPRNAAPFFFFGVPSWFVLRIKRSELRRRKLLVSGQVLVETLIRYSEHGQAYVEDFKSIIRQNRLADADDGYLRDMPVIRIVIADETSK